MNKQQIKQKQIKLGLKTDWQHFWIVFTMIVLLISFWLWCCHLFLKDIGSERVYFEENISQDLNYIKTSPTPQILPNLPIVEPTTKQLIESLAKEHNVDVETALKIAECESQFGKYNYNWQGSSAKGVYHFIDSTWENYCDGDVLNEKDNITCFMKLYNKFPHWWEQCNIIINK